MNLTRIIRMVCACAVAAATVAACGKLDETIDQAQDRIVAALKSQGLWERNNLPIENPPPPEQIKGEYDIVEGAYRYVANETRADRAAAPQIAEGDSIAFRFDGRVFTGGAFDSQTTFYTNIASRIAQIGGNNAQFSTEFWPTVPLKIRVGNDPRILKSLQRALISCRAALPASDTRPEGVASDRVLIYLTPDLAFGANRVYGVPARSTLVFEITEIEIIK